MPALHMYDLRSSQLLELRVLLFDICKHSLGLQRLPFLLILFRFNQRKLGLLVVKDHAEVTHEAHSDVSF